MSDVGTKEQFLVLPGKIEVLMDDETTGIISLKTKTFDPQMAKAIADQILHFSEVLVNELSEQITVTAWRRAETERSGRTATAQMLPAPDRIPQSDQHPRSHGKTGAVMGIVTALGRATGRKRAETISCFTCVPAVPVIVTVNARIKALEDQIAKENQRLTGRRESQVSAILQDYRRFSHWKGDRASTGPHLDAWPASRVRVRSNEGFAQTSLTW